MEDHGAMIQVLSKVVIKADEVDSLVWKHDKLNEYLVKSFLSVIYKDRCRNLEPNMYNFSSKLWIRLVPPRVELLTWFIILGRLNTMDRLCSLKMLSEDETLCIL
ncbi:uncharacterized protein DS421_2g51590 [Arachis hypogaea]|nr:uncharacterized protein DS421_2g51590 [Arachis hypogaea]